MGSGTVARLRRYPVKSMKGEDLDRALLSTSGMVGDRLYAFLDENRKNETKFPWGWITARQIPELLLFEPKYLRNDVKRLEFLSKEGRMSAEEMIAYLTRKYSLKVSLKFDKEGNFDSKPVSMIGLSTVRQLETESVEELDPERFRANIYAEWEDQRPFHEDDLVGNTLIIGNAKIKILEKNSRCSIPTLDPKTAKATPKIQENITRTHGGFTGVYASVEENGEVKVGDEIIIE